MCAAWAPARCADSASFMAKFCVGSCDGAAGFEHVPPSNPSNPSKGDVHMDDAHVAEHLANAQADKEAAEAAKTEPKTEPKTEVEEGGDSDYTPSGPFDESSSDLTVAQFDDLLHSNQVVMVNYYAPWCFWSNKLTPDWLAVGRRVHKRAWSQSVKFLRVDCTTAKGQKLCQAQSIHAFPSVRIYRGSSHAFEPYEYGREENVIWLHLVKVAAEALVASVNELTPEERRAYSTQIGHVSADLRTVMERREQGLDEDWSEDALSADEEVAEDQDILARISDAVGSVTGAKGVITKGELDAHLGGGAGQDGTAEMRLVNERASDVVLGLLTGRAPTKASDDPDAEPWTESETHEGCNVFGYIDVSRAPGTIHVAPHSPRHSFDFSALNTTHSIDHLSFGLELTARERAQLPPSVLRQLTTLDGTLFLASQPTETKEHHVNIMPTSFGSPSESITTYQFTATSHGRTRETIPSVVISYDVSPIHAHVTETQTPMTDFLISLCAIIGGAVSVFGIVDAVLFAGTGAVKRSMGGGRKAY
jgi:hypothetical protein